MSLSASNLSFSYQRPSLVLHGVNVELRQGITAIVGPNGAGKTTLLKLLGGLLEPHAGAVTLHGRALTSHAARERARYIAYVPQHASVSAAFNVRQVVELGRYAVGDDEQAIQRAMTTLEITTLGHRIYGELSAGQQQRVTLARAIAQLDGKGDTPRFLLADEPMSAMDPEHQLHTMAVLRHIAERGVAVLIVLHDLTMARRLAEHAIVLGSDGAIAIAGPAEKTLTPEILQRVFRVRFEETSTASGVILVPASRS